MSVLVLSKSTSNRRCSDATQLHFFLPEMDERGSNTVSLVIWTVSTSSADLCTVPAGVAKGVSYPLAVSGGPFVWMVSLRAFKKTPRCADHSVT